MGETRKIAAILAADVVGYSRLAGADEDRTLARLRALRSDLIDPTIAVHHGRVVKRTGDGALVEFRSVVEAVRCAIELQNSMLERDRPGFRDPFEPCGDVDTVAHQIAVAFLDDITEVNTDAEIDAAVGRQASIAACRRTPIAKSSHGSGRALPDRPGERLPAERRLRLEQPRVGACVPQHQVGQYRHRAGTSGEQERDSS
jgi:hypothetical protein